ncbi:hypothetical protein EVB99_019 [Rhizobium phage RHph_N3_19]|nr:hypothetical protein EVB99_019 [Rhizobium phage RHph_N3_19]
MTTFNTRVTCQNDIEVGDIIRSHHYEWLVVSLEKDGTFSTRHRRVGSNDRHEDSPIMRNWGWNSFRGIDCTLIKPFPQFKYNPNQTGDTEDDI